MSLAACSMAFCELSGARATAAAMLSKRSSSASSAAAASAKEESLPALRSSLLTAGWKSCAGEGVKPKRRGQGFGVGGEGGRNRKGARVAKGEAFRWEGSRRWSRRLKARAITPPPERHPLCGPCALAVSASLAAYSELQVAALPKPSEGVHNGMR